MRQHAVGLKFWYYQNIAGYTELQDPYAPARMFFLHYNLSSNLGEAIFLPFPSFSFLLDPGFADLF